jgi:putative ABC transport system permease protein
VNEVFGIPAGALVVVLVVALVAALGALAVLAARHPVLVRLGVRNVGRRRGRTALIVLGLMLGTAIVAASLATGDTMRNTIRSGTLEVLGQTDEVVAVPGTQAATGTELGAASGRTYFPEAVAGRVRRSLAGSGLADGVTPAIVEAVAAQAPARRRNEPRITLFAADPAAMAGFGEILGSAGAATPLDALGPGEAYLDEEGARELGVGPGERILVLAGGRPAPVRVRDVVRYDGAGTDGSALLMPLAQAQALVGAPGRVNRVLVSNAGDATSGASSTDRVLARVEPAVAPLGLEVDPTKRDGLEAADEAGSAFMSFFTTFGSFSIAAGVLLIFLIFVMLAAERRSELGIARAVGTRRGHLVEMFVFEGAAYDLAAALVGALLGAGVAFAMVAVMDQAFSAEGMDLGYAVTGRSLVIAYALGVLLTLVVVAVSAWRVSRMTISSAIRDLPDPPPPARRRRWATAGAGLVVGLLMAASGAGGGQATPLMIGISLVIISLVPVVRLLGVPDRLAYTLSGLVIVVLWMLPWDAWEAVFGELAMDFSTWIAAGLMVVVGTVWVIVFNADLLLGVAASVLGRIRSLAPVLRLSMAYPLSARFRTGTTLAMFTLVVFTLVTGTVTSGSFIHAAQDVERFGGGFDVRAGTAGVAPIDDLAAAIRREPGLRAEDYTAVGSQSFLPLDARQEDTDRAAEPYPVRGLDQEFLERTTFALAATARGYSSPREVWRAIATRPGLAVVDAYVVPRRDQFGFAAMPSDFRLSGFVIEDSGFAPVPVEVSDPRTGTRLRLSVIGVLSDAAPIEMLGLSTSQRTLAGAFPGRARPTIHYVGVAPGVDPDDAAARLESAFLARGMEAESMRAIVEEATAESLTFNRLIQGFMGLGLVVGVAALGVISARAAVERRQQIGVLRAIGFRRRMVQATLLLESSFVALTAIVVGTALGLLLARNIISDSRRQPSWDNLTMVVPWTNLAVIFLVVLAVALGATLAPALRASRTAPAEALRYQ